MNLAFHYKKFMNKQAIVQLLGIQNLHFAIWTGQESSITNLTAAFAIEWSCIQRKPTCLPGIAISSHCSSRTNGSNMANRSGLLIP